MLRNSRNIFWIFLALWLILNVIQASLTGLFNDEAYYYFYSTHLAWGYYDHPPIIALFIQMGYALFHNELGVRLFYVILSSGTLFLLFKLSDVKNELLFSVLAFSFMIFQITGFLALPDSPLIFFTALFFYIYRKYSETYSTRHAVMLGVVMAALFYSKYLGIFVVFFTVISDLRLLLKKSFWLAVLVTTGLFIPHLYWQYLHDFPSFYYHLLERSHDEVFRWKNFGEFILGQAGMVNPILFIPVIYFLIKFKPASQYDKALKFTAAGSLLLPFLMMIKGRVEANWTMAGLVPLFLITYKLFESRPKMQKFSYITGFITLALVLAVRTLLIYNYLPEKYSKMLKLDLQGWKPFSEKLAEMAGNRPVIFIGSYQGPSHYLFHTGKEAFAFNDYLYRNNQFNLEGLEENLQGREVMLIFPRKSLSEEDILNNKALLNDSIQVPGGKYKFYFYEKNYHSYNYLPVEIPPADHTFKVGEEIEIPLVLKNPGHDPVDFSLALPSKVFLCSYLFQYGKPLIYNYFEDISSLILKDEYKTSCKMKMPEKPGVYYMKISIKNGWMPAGLNSRLVKVRVE